MNTRKAQDWIIKVHITGKALETHGKRIREAFVEILNDMNDIPGVTCKSTFDNR